MDEREPQRPAAEQWVQERGIRRSRTKTQRIIVVFVVVVLLAVVAGGWLLLRPRQDVYALSTWEAARVVRRDLRQTLQASGSLDVERQEDVVAMEPGIASAAAVRVGDRVRAGEALLRIDSKSLQDQMAQSQSSLAKSRRDLERLALEHDFLLKGFDRDRPGLLRAVEEAAQAVKDAERLAAANAATTKDVKTARDRETAAREALAKRDADRQQAIALYDLTRTNAQADIDILQSGIERLQDDLAACTVTAPFAATVMQVYVQAGAFVSQYQKLFNLADTSRPQVILDVPESVVRDLTVGQGVTVDAGGGRYDARIARIGLQAQANSSGTATTVPVYVEFTTPPASVIPGGSASGEILLGVKKGALVLPRGPYLSTGSQRWLYVVDGGRAVRTEAAYGLIQATEVEVLSGVKEGDVVITSGYQDFIDRTDIRLRPQGGATK